MSDPFGEPGIGELKEKLAAWEPTIALVGRLRATACLGSICRSYDAIPVALRPSSTPAQERIKELETYISDCLIEAHAVPAHPSLVEYRYMSPRTLERFKAVVDGMEGNHEPV